MPDFSSHSMSWCHISVFENIMLNGSYCCVSIVVSKVAMLGMTFKEDCPDTRNTANILINRRGAVELVQS